MGNFSILRSKTFWFTFAGAVIHAASAPPEQRAQAIGESVAAIGTAWGLRSAVAKNGENK